MIRPSNLVELAEALVNRSEDLIGQYYDCNIIILNPSEKIIQINLVTGQIMIIEPIENVYSDGYNLFSHKSAIHNITNEISTKNNSKSEHNYQRIAGYIQNGSYIFITPFTLHELTNLLRFNNDDVIDQNSYNLYKTALTLHACCLNETDISALISLGCRVYKYTRRRDENDD